MELGSSDSEDDFPMVMLEPARRSQGQNEMCGPSSVVSISTTATRRADKIVLSSDSENELKTKRTKVDHASVSPPTSLQHVHQFAGTTVGEPRCHETAPAAVTLTSTSRNLPPPEQRKTLNEAKRGEQVGTYEMGPMATYTINSMY